MGVGGGGGRFAVASHAGLLMDLHMQMRANMPAQSAIKATADNQTSARITGATRDFFFFPSFG